jgi:hypothetical protein
MCVGLNLDNLWPLSLFSNHLVMLLHWLVVIASVLAAASASHPAIHTFLSSVSDERRARASSVISATLTAPATRVCPSTML